MRRMVALLLTVLSCTGAAVVPSANAEERAQQWLITRTGRGPAPLRGTFTASTGSSAATALLFAVVGTGRHREVGGAFTHTRVDMGVDGWPRVYGTAQPDCPGGACRTPFGVPFTIGFSSGRWTLGGTVVIATWDFVDVRIEVDVPGWQVRRVRPGIRVVASDEAGDAGIRAPAMSAGRFTGATLSGGKHGSYAWGRLPCDVDGEGSATFTGGPKRRALDCQGTLIDADDTPGPTQWRLTGHVSGIASAPNVLVVVDFPPES